ncbi:MAG: hypothetical protein JSS76_02035 [Bacteroidetes bacterium]|nr:hypothetical protein [Bacteroidota bacterium]
MKSITFVLIFLSSSIFAQSFHLSEPDSLRQEGDVKEAIAAFRQKYTARELTFDGLYNYACALVVDGQSDSAFRYLDSLYGRSSSPEPALFGDPDFITLRNDKRWGLLESQLIDRIQTQSGHAYKDVEYARKLWLMMAWDQAYYDCLHIAQKKIGMASPVVKALWDLKNRINSENQKQLEELIAAKGWPRISQVGERAATGAFLIIQHADTDKQKKYIPVLEKLCKESEASLSDYALMYDRILIHEQKPQKYGSQVKYNEQTEKYELYPLLDENKVDEWRKDVGLRPLAEYLSIWGIKFEPHTK